MEASCTICGYALPIISEYEEGVSEAIPPVEDRCLRFGKRTDTATYTKHYVDDNPINGLYYVDDITETQIAIRQMALVGGVCVEVTVGGSYDDTETSVIRTGDAEGEMVRDATTVYSGAFNSGTGLISGTLTYTDSVNPDDNYSDTFEISPIAGFDVSGMNYTSPGHYDFSVTTDLDDLPQYEGEETTGSQVDFSEPVDTCEPEYPAWPEWSEATSSGQASRVKSGTCGLTLTLEKTKWRLKHAPSGTCYLKVWLRKTFTPAATDPPTDPLPDPTVTETTYEWTGTGNPCLADPTKAIDHADNAITGSETEVGAPEEEGVTTIEILKYSCVEGYEPDISDEENPQPNGFPDPTWEAAAP